MTGVVRAADGYFEIVKPKALDFVEPERNPDDNDEEDEICSDAPSACQCGKRFGLGLMRTLRREWMRSEPVTYDGSIRITDEAWIAAGIKRSCCRKTLMTFVPVNLIHSVYEEANRVHPSDWVMEDFVAIDDKRIVVTKHVTTATRSFYEDPRRFRLGLKQ